jgi:hypothetical protein
MEAALLKYDSMIAVGKDRLGATFGYLNVEMPIVRAGLDGSIRIQASGGSGPSRLGGDESLDSLVYVSPNRLKP